MNGLILTVAIVAATPSISEGTILYLENSNDVVEFYTGSEKTHVAIVFSDSQHQWVYEAAPGKVRRVTLKAYLKNISKLNLSRSEKIRVFLQAPNRDYSPREVYEMRRYLDRQLGRRYTIKSFLQGGKSKGLHCAQLVAEGLNRSDRFSLGKSSSLSPAQLLRATKKEYGSTKRIRLKSSPSQLPWCTRTWNSWSAFGKWCSWSCDESWDFFRF